MEAWSLCVSRVKSRRRRTDDEWVRGTSSGTAAKFERNDPEAGFSLIELLVVMVLMSIVMTLVFGAGRQLWFRRSLTSARGDVTFALKGLQQKTVAESNPLVYGARLRPNATQFTTYRYDPLVTSGDPCVPTGTQEFSAGVEVATSEFEVYRVGGLSTGPDVASLCDGGAPQTYVFFFARGEATAGRVVLRQPRVSSSNTATIDVFGLTGRVEASD